MYHLSHLTMQLEQNQTIEETMWTKRARFKWLKEGDNTPDSFIT